MDLGVPRGHRWIFLYICPLSTTKYPGKNPTTIKGGERKVDWLGTSGLKETMVSSLGFLFSSHIFQTGYQRAFNPDSPRVIKKKKSPALAKVPIRDIAARPKTSISNCLIYLQHWHQSSRERPTRIFPQHQQKTT